MTIHHRELAAGRWFTFPFLEQMAHIGSEVERALVWKERGRTDHCTLACERMLELLDLTLADLKNRSRLRELARLREALVDYFYGANEYGSSDILWRKYFDPFAYAVRRSY